MANTPSCAGCSGDESGRPRGIFWSCLLLLLFWTLLVGGSIASAQDALDIGPQQSNQAECDAPENRPFIVAEFPDGDTIEGVLHHFKEGDYSVVTARGTLIRFSEDDATSILFRAHPSQNNDEAADLSLEELIDQFARYQHPYDSQQRDPALIAELAAAGPAAIEPLIALVNEDDEIYQSVGKIFHLMGPDAAPHLIEAVRRDGRGRGSSYLTVWWALCQGGIDSVPLTRVMMDDEDPRIRDLALHALYSIDVGSVETLPAGFVSRLIELLDDSNSEVRTKVPAILGKLVRHTDVIIPVLISTLNDDRHADLDHKSVLALGSLGPKLRSEDPMRQQALEALLDAVENQTDSSVRSSAALYLGYFEESATVSIAALRRAAEDPEEHVRKSAREVLYRLGSSPSEEVSEVGIAGQTSLALVEMLAGEDRTASNAARAELSTREPNQELVDALIAAVRDDNNNRYWQIVAYIIAAWDEEAALPALECFARDENARVRRSAAHAYGHMSLSSLPESASVLCEDREGWVRAQMSQSLALMSEQATLEMIEGIVPLLIAGLNDEAVQNPHGYWWRAAGGLEEIGLNHPDVVPAFIDLMINANDESIRGNASSKLCSLVRPLREDHEDVERIVMAIVEAIGREPRPAARSTFIWQLGTIGARAESALPALRNAVDDPYEAVSQAAKETISKIQGED